MPSSKRLFSCFVINYSVVLTANTHSGTEVGHVSKHNTKPCLSQAAEYHFLMFLRLFQEFKAYYGGKADHDRQDFSQVITTFQLSV